MVWAKALRAVWVRLVWAKAVWVRAPWAKAAWVRAAWAKDALPEWAVAAVGLAAWVRRAKVNKAVVKAVSVPCSGKVMPGPDKRHPLPQRPHRTSPLIRGNPKAAGKIGVR